MKYHVAMLCGGESMMLSPSDGTKIDMTSMAKEFGDSVLRANKDMIEFMFKGIKLTLYPNGRIMFYHFTDLESAKCYADEIMATVGVI